MVHSYRDLIVWQKAIDMVTNIYRATQSFPGTKSMAVSVPSTMAEGQVVAGDGNPTSNRKKPRLNV